MIKKCLVFITFSLVTNASLAETSVDMTFNKHVDACIRKYGENHVECLEEVSEKSEAALDKAYNDKLKEMEGFDYTRWWMGDEERKKHMIASFKKSHLEWLKYRNDFCSVAVTNAQSTHYLGAAITGCEINMNNRHIHDIGMLKLIDSD